MSLESFYFYIKAVEIVKVGKNFIMVCLFVWVRGCPLPAGVLFNHRQSADFFAPLGTVMKFVQKLLK